MNDLDRYEQLTVEVSSICSCTVYTPTSTHFLVKALPENGGSNAHKKIPDFVELRGLNNESRLV